MVSALWLPSDAAPPRDEPLRPQFHFTAPAGWLNDPNGLVCVGGEWHLFYQWRPQPEDGPDKHWGHAVSRDLLHWTDLPVALSPDENGSVWSGSAVVDAGNVLGLRKGRTPVLAAFYTAAGGITPESAGKRFTQFLATSSDRGRTWVRHPRNPVLAHVVGENRDPKVVFHAPTGRWIMALYLTGHTYGLFASADLLRWEEIQRLEMPGCSECPDFFEMPVEGEPGQRRWVFTAANGWYLVGTFDGREFRREFGPAPQDAGPNHYAVQTFSGVPRGDGRTIQIAWMAGGQYPGMPFTQQMGVPSELTLRRDPSGSGWRLHRTPVRELRRLRGTPIRHASVVLKEGGPPLEFRGELLDVELETELPKGAALELDLRGLALRLDGTERAASLAGRSAPLGPGPLTRLRLLLDRTSVEAFVDDGSSTLSACFLPRPEDRSELRAVRGEARVRRLAVWPLRSVWRR